MAATPYSRKDTGSGRERVEWAHGPASIAPSEPSSLTWWGRNLPPRSRRPVVISRVRRIWCQCRDQRRALRRFKPVKKFGVIYNPYEANSALAVEQLKQIDHTVSVLVGRSGAPDGAGAPVIRIAELL